MLLAQLGFAHCASICGHYANAWKTTQPYIEMRSIFNRMEVSDAWTVTIRVETEPSRE